MEEKEGSNWKVRLANYESILKQIANPTPQLLQQLQSDLPKYLADVNPNCFRVALSICEQYFSCASSINYPQIARILIEKGFTTNRPANADSSTQLLLKCIQHSHDSVLTNVFDELNSKSVKIVIGMISLLNNYINESGNTDSTAIIEHLTPLLDHRDQNIRKEANAVISLARGAPSPISKPHETVASPSPSSPHQRQKSPAKETVLRPKEETTRRNRSPVHKRRINMQNASSMWSSWVSKSTLELLKHQKWQSVVSGFEELRKSYTEESGNPSACAYGLATLFINRTFTPKVMTNLVNEILFYMKEDTVNITDDTITAILHFVIDKITDKRLEVGLFEMADIVCELMTPPYVFQSFYQHLTAKNPGLPSRICCYFSHSIQAFGIESKLNPDEVSEQIKPLFAHSDPNVRKSALECVASLAAIFGENVLESFKFLKPNQLSDIRKSMASIGKNAPPPRTSGIPSKTMPLSFPKKQQNMPPQEANNSPKRIDRSPSPPAPSNIRMKNERLSPPAANPSSIPISTTAGKIKSDPSPPNDAAHRLPKKPRNVTQRNFAQSGGELIPSRLIQGISKTTSSAVEIRRSLDELEELLNRSLELRGPSSVKPNEFSSLFSNLTPYFIDTNTETVTSVAKILLTSLQLIDPNDMKNVDNDIIMESVFLLNYQEKAIRSTAINIMSEWNSMVPYFVQNILLEVFPRLSIKGKKAAVAFVRDNVNFNMTIQPFLPFIVSCMSDKDEELRESSAPLVQRYLQMPGAVNAIKDYIEYFNTAKKNAILSMINSKDSQSCFIQKPTAQQKEHREQKIDCYLPLKVLNESEDASALTEKLEHYGSRYFNITDFSSTEPAKIEKNSKIFLTAATEEFESFSLTLDIVFLWWAQLSLLIRHKDSFDEIFHFFLKLLSILDENQRFLEEFELNLILPIVLECVGRGYLDERCSEIETLVFKLSPPEYLIPSLVLILGKVTSVNAVQADFNALLELIPKLGLGKMQADLVNTATRLHSTLSKDPSKDPDLYQTSVKFIEFLKKNGLLSSTLDSRPISRCNLSPKISAKLKQPSILVYQWIVDLSSQDTQIIIQALKSISQQLKVDPKIFEPHLEALIVSLITSVHTYFPNDPPANRLCKYIAFCLLTLFNETTLKDTIPQEFVQQLIYEMLTHLSNGINETVLNQVLNALIVKLINDCTMFAFVGLLSAISEYDNKEQFTERWIRLALKCFEACGVRICEVKDEKSILESIILVNQMLINNNIEQLDSSAIGKKIVGVLKSYVNLVFEKFSDVVNTKEMKKKLGNDAEIYKLVG